MKICRCNDVFRYTLGRWRSFLILVVAALVLPLGEHVFAAAAVSPQMIEQLKRLPRAEQEALARQYGVDRASLEGTGTISGALDTGIGAPGQPLEPHQGLHPRRRVL